MLETTIHSGDGLFNELMRLGVPLLYAVHFLIAEEHVVSESHTPYSAVSTETGHSTLAALATAAVKIRPDR